MHSLCVIHTSAREWLFESQVIDSKYGAVCPLRPGCGAGILRSGQSQDQSAGRGQLAGSLAGNGRGGHHADSHRRTESLAEDQQERQRSMDGELGRLQPTRQLRRDGFSTGDVGGDREHRQLLFRRSAMPYGSRLDRGLLRLPEQSMPGARSNGGAKSIAACQRSARSNRQLLFRRSPMHYRTGLDGRLARVSEQSMWSARAIAGPGVTPACQRGPRSN